MSFFEITGGRSLSGSIQVHGAKNSVLPILAACVLGPGESVIRNCPDLTDVRAALDILEVLGCRVCREGDAVRVDASVLDCSSVPERLMREMRSSVLFLGAMLGRLGEAELSYPGGCELGPRPIDLHLAALRELGAEIREEQGLLRCRGGKQMRGRRICLSFPSVGATENIMLAACTCEGVTTIVGAAREPEIVDLQRFLNEMGAQIRGAGDSVITICGTKTLHPAQYAVMGDRIVAATYLAAVGAAGGEIEVTGVEPDHLSAVLSVLEEAGCRLHSSERAIRMECAGPLGAVRRIRTTPYPGFPTDAQAVLMAALAAGRGTTMFEENMFDSRYRHVDELTRMGADIRLSGRTAVVNGRPLHAARVCSTDLRGGAALVVAALSAEGTSCVGQLHHIDRGYDHLENGLCRLGAQICRRN